MPTLHPFNPLCSQQRAVISYPCAWTYKVIGEDRQLLHQAITIACAPHEVMVSPSHQSSKGRYVSVNADVVVPSETVRLHIFERLKNSEAVKFVL
jgi:uncharacterized protein